jgi:hypothetical protein
VLTSTALTRSERCALVLAASREGTKPREVSSAGAGRQASGMAGRQLEGPGSACGWSAFLLDGTQRLMSCPARPPAGIPAHPKPSFKPPVLPCPALPCQPGPKCPALPWPLRLA